MIAALCTLAGILTGYRLPYGVHALRAMAYPGRGRAAAVACFAVGFFGIPINVQ